MAELTWKSEVALPPEPESTTYASMHEAWFVDGTLNGHLGNYNFAWSQQHPTGHLGTKNGEVYLFADKAGSDDDELTAANVPALHEVSSFPKQTLVCVFTPEANTDSFQYLLRENYSAWYVRLYPDGVAHVGYSSTNSYEYVARLPAGAVKWGVSNTLVISVDTVLRNILINFNGKVWSDATTYDGAQSYLRGGVTARGSDLASIKIGGSTHTNYYRFKGTVHMLALFGQAFDQTTIDAIHADPFSIFRTREEKRQQYYLPFDGTDDKGTIPALVSTNNSSNINWDLEARIKLAGDTMAIMGDAALNIFLVRLDGSVGCGTGIAWSNGTLTNISDWFTVKVTLRWSGSDKVASLYKDGVFINSYIVSQASIPAFSIFGGWGTSNFRPGNLAWLKYTDYENSANNRYYDANTPGETQLIERINGQHGTLVGGLSFAPIRPTIEYTVGAPAGTYDYEHINQATSNINSAAYQYVLKLYGQQTVSSGAYAYIPAADPASGSRRYVTLEAGNNAFDGTDFSAANPHFNGLPIRLRIRTELVMVGLKLANGSYLAGYSAIDNRVDIDSCALVNVAYSAAIEGISNSKILVKNSFIDNAVESVTRSLGTAYTPEFRDTLIRNCGGYASSYAFKNEANVQNCVVLWDGNFTYGGSITAFNPATVVEDYNRIERGGKFGANTLDNLTISPNFSNNGIDQTWANANLTGQGWNGSNICGSFYYTAAGPTVQELTIPPVESGCEVVVIWITEEAFLSAAATEQATEVEALSLTQAQSLALAAVEQLTEVVPEKIAASLLLSVLELEQATEFAPLSLINSLALTPAAVEQLAEFVPPSLTQQLLLTTQPVEQETEYETAKTWQSLKLFAVTAEQLTEVELVVLEDGNPLIAVIVEQATEVELDSLTLSQSLNAAPTEQSNEYEPSTLAVEQSLNASQAEIEVEIVPPELFQGLHLTVPAVEQGTEALSVNLAQALVVKVPALEQLTEVELVEILVTNLDLNPDQIKPIPYAEAIKLVRTTPVYGATRTTVTYNSERR